MQSRDIGSIDKFEELFYFILRSIGGMPLISRFSRWFVNHGFALARYAAYRDM